MRQSLSLLLLSIVGATAYGQIAFVNTGTNSNVTGTNVANLAVPATSATTGNGIAVGVSWYNATTPPTTMACTDTAGNTYTSLGVTKFDANNAVTILIAKNITGHASNVVTCTPAGGGTYFTIITAQYSGLSTTAPVDTSNLSNSGATTSVSYTSGAFTTTSADEVIVAFGQNSGGLGMTFTAGSGYTKRSTGSGGLSAFEDKIVSSIQTGVTASMTCNLAGNWGMAVATLRAPTAVTTINADNANIVLTGRWGQSGSGSSARAKTITAGSYIDVTLSGTQSVIMNFDETGLNASGYPDILYQMDGGSPTRATLSTGAGMLVTAAFPVASMSTHRLRIYAEGITEGSAPVAYNQWSSQAGALIFQGLTLDLGGSTLPIPASPNTMEVMGDSLTASIRQLCTSGGGSNSTAACMAAHNSWAMQVGQYLGLRTVMSGYGGTGVTVSGSGSVPACAASFPYAYSGVAYSPAAKPIAVIFAYGTNDTAASGAAFRAAYTACLAVVRTAYPNSYIFCLGLPSISHASDISTAVTTLADAKVFYLNYTALSMTTTDGTHYDTAGATTLAARLATDVQAQLTTSGVVMGLGTTAYISFQ